MGHRKKLMGDGWMAGWLTGGRQEKFNENNMSVNLIEFNDDWNNFIMFFERHTFFFLHCLEILMNNAIILFLQVNVSVRISILALLVMNPNYKTIKTVAILTQLHFSFKNIITK